MKVKKAYLMIGFLLVVLALIAYGVYYAFEQARNEEIQRENASYASSSQRIVSVGEPLRLDSEEDSIGYEFGNYVAIFSWNGVMYVEVVEAKMLDTLEGLSLENRYFVSHDIPEDCKYLALNVRVENESAYAETPGPTGVYEEDLLYISTVSNLLINGERDGGVSPVIYFDGTPDNAGPKDSYQCHVPVGESRDYLLIFAVPQDVEIKEASLGMGVCVQEKYQIKFMEGGEIIDGPDARAVEAGL